MPSRTTRSARRVGRSITFQLEVMKKSKSNHQIIGLLAQSYPKLSITRHPTE